MEILRSVLFLLYLFSDEFISRDAKITSQFVMVPRFSHKYFGTRDSDMNLVRH
jgi:hypothetical protein